MNVSLMMIFTLYFILLLNYSFILLIVPDFNLLELIMTSRFNFMAIQPILDFRVATILIDSHILEYIDIVVDKTGSSIKVLDNIG